MKLIYKIFAAAASILALSSCVESAIEPMTGKYGKPVVYEMNTLASQSVEKGDKYRTFTVELSGDDNTSMTLKMVNDKYFLADGTYTPAPADQAKKNTYIVGNGGTTFNNIPVETGSIKVAQGEGTYSFAGILWLADESVIEIKSTVALVYEADPEPVKLSTVLSATSNLANGVQTVTMQLAQDGIYSETDMTTWQTIWHGEGNYLAIDLYSADGYLHEGTYSASAVGGVVGEGEFGIGYDTTVDFGWGPMEMKDWGTCWWSVSNGAATAKKILEGTINVSKKGSKWVIELISGEGKEMIWAKFEGAVDALTDPALGGGGNVDDTDYVELTKLLSATKNQGLLTINMAQDGISSTTDPNTWQTIWEGEGNYLAADIYSADGKLYTGEYKACAVGGTVGEGEFGIGYDTTVDWGWGPMEMKDWGTCWWSVSNGAATAKKILEGTINVSKKGSKWVIELISGEGKEMIWAKFEGAVDALTDPALGGGGNVDDTDYVELTKLLSATKNQGLLTINMAQDGISSTTDPNTWQTIWEGEGNYLAADIYSADGKLYTGEYKACAVGGTVGEGEFGIGYDTTVDWGWGPMEMKDWGTCWWTVADGATSAVKILDGTMTVAMEGDNVVIKLKSSVVNAKFTYPVAQFVDGTGAPIEVVNLGGGEGNDPAPDYTEFTKLLIVQPNQAYNESGQPTGEYTSFTLKVGTDGMYTEVVNNGWYDETKIKGTGQVLTIDFYTTDGTVAAGTYTACEVGGTINEGEFGIGYDVEMWGTQMVWGTCVTPYDSDTEGTIEKVTDGTVTVEISGDVYTITLESSNINAQYIGSLTL